VMRCLVRKEKRIEFCFLDRPQRKYHEIPHQGNSSMNLREIVHVVIEDSDVESGEGKNDCGSIYAREYQLDVSGHNNFKQKFWKSEQTHCRRNLTRKLKKK
jgi:hypothetical protein